MKHFIVLPIRRDRIVGGDAVEVLALMDEELLRMAVTLLDREREIERLRRQTKVLRAQLAECACKK